MIADGSLVPLALRKDGEFYLLVDLCWRIVAKVSSWKDMLVGEWEDGSETKTRYAGINDDPGFSVIMRGRIRGNPAFVRTKASGRAPERNSGFTKFQVSSPRNKSAANRFPASGYRCNDIGDMALID